MRIFAKVSVQEGNLVYITYLFKKKKKKKEIKVESYCDAKLIDFRRFLSTSKQI